ncbi:MAG: hypothetical protein H6650_22155 [Ardenticatenales bacterium]|nr:hypothetical protein [Ardenticatenales bacterium]
MSVDVEMINVKCQACGHVWQVDPAQIGREQQVIYRGAETVRVRVQCPVDHAYVIVELPKRYLPWTR